MELIKVGGDSTCQTFLSYNIHNKKWELRHTNRGRFLLRTPRPVPLCPVPPNLPFVVSRAFMAGAASEAGDADSSRAPGLISGLQGSVNVHHGALLLVP